MAAIDMVVSDLQRIIERVKFYDSGFLMKISESDGLVLNDPFNNNELYHIYDSDVTKLNMEHWNIIRDRSNSEE